METQVQQPPTHAPPRRPVVFYDGDCPLCRREIGHYRAIDRGGAIEWLDLHQSGERLQAAGITHDQAMARLHVIDPDREADGGPDGGLSGAIVSGVPGFLAIWRRLPGYRHLATLVSALRLTGPLDRAYTRFARWRLRRRCREGSCEIG